MYCPSQKRCSFDSQRTVAPSGRVSSGWRLATSNRVTLWSPVLKAYPNRRPTSGDAIGAGGADGLPADTVVGATIPAVGRELEFGAHPPSSMAAAPALAPLRNARRPTSTAASLPAPARGAQSAGPQ